MDSLLPEILIRVFSYLDPGSFSKVASTCSRWCEIISDEQLWKSAFVQRWGRLPIKRQDQASWRREYIKRQLFSAKWLNSNPQIISLRLPEVGDGGIKDVCLGLDKQTIFLTSLECLAGAQMAKRAVKASPKVQRNSLFYSSRIYNEGRVTAAKFGLGNNSLALGLDNGSLVIYPNLPIESLNTNFLYCENTLVLNGRERLPVQRIMWSSPRNIIFLCKFEDFPNCALVRCKVTTKPTVELIANDYNIWNWCVDDEDQVYWITNSTVRSTRGWTLNLDGIVLKSPQISRLGQFILVSHSGDKIFWLVDRMIGKIVHKYAIGPIRKIILSPSNTFVVLLGDNSSIYRSNLTDAGDALEFSLVRDKLLLDASVLDVAVDEFAIIVFCERKILNFDSLSLQLLGQYLFPQRFLKTRRKDLDATGRIIARFISCSVEGHVLIQWGMNGLHFLNFGNRLKRWESVHPSGTPRSTRLTRHEITQNLFDDLMAIEDRRAESEERQRLTEKYGISNLSEADMLQLAQMMSLEDCSLPLSQSHGDEDSEFELQLAITMSLSLAEQSNQPPS